MNDLEQLAIERLKAAIDTVIDGDEGIRGGKLLVFEKKLVTMWAQAVGLEVAG